MSPSIARNVYEVATILKNKYRDFAHYNKSNPFDELLFILCSTRTSEVGYRDTYRSLRKRFPQNQMLACASKRAVAAAITKGGLSNKKAAAIKRIISLLVREFGRPTLAPLRQWPDEKCEKFLVSLPGVGRKVARCVMLYSLGREVFPVDGHCWRVSKRLGWIRQTRRNRSGSPRDEDRLQEKIPGPFRHSLHVNMISLGRNFCSALRPRCSICPITRECRKVGVAK